MKTQLVNKTVVMTQEQSAFILQIAKQEYFSFSAATRLVLSLGIEMMQHSNFLQAKEKVDSIDKEIESLQNQKQRLSFQRDYLKDRVEDE